MDKADILKLDEAGLLLRQRIIIAKIERIDADDPDNDEDPRIKALLVEGEFIVKCLDPIMRERHRDNPAKLSEWDEIFHSCDDLHEEGDANLFGGKTP